MRDILSARNRSALREIARSHSLLAFDYDGTLSPIVTDPALAVMRPGTRALLTELAEMFPCALISGRARADLMMRAGDLPMVEYVGNHGLEWGDKSVDLRAVARRAQAWLPILEKALADCEGVEIENKRYSISVHYRQARSKREARAKLDEALRRIRGARLIGGKDVVNLVPRGSLNKGSAIQKLRRLYRAERLFYIGDDVTDEDVFELEKPWLLSVHVGKTRSAAEFCIRSQAEIDSLLRELVRLRRAEV